MRPFDVHEAHRHRVVTLFSQPMTHPSFKPSSDPPPRTEMADTIGGGGFATERQLDALGRVASVVAHELTNLLQILSSSLDRLTASPDPDGIAMRTVRGSIDRGTRLARQLQTFAQTAPPRLQLREIHQLIAGWMPEFEDTIGPEHRLELRLRFSGPIVVDADQLETALVNLLSNARDASQSGSVIILELSRAEAGARGPGAGCRIAVIDHGEGMTDDVARQAVAPFFTTRPPGKGMGLGLTIARMVAEAHGGSLEIDSAFGRGTTVSMSLTGGAAAGRDRTTEPAASMAPAQPQGASTHGAGASRGGVVPSPPLGSQRSAGAGTGAGSPGASIPGAGTPGSGTHVTSVSAPAPGPASHMPASHTPGPHTPGLHAVVPPPPLTPLSPTSPLSARAPQVPQSPLSPLSPVIGPIEAPSSSGHILVIDDEEAIAEYFRIILSAEHYDVSVVTSAHQALDRFAQNPSRYDTVLLDMMLRDGSGIDLYRKFRQLRPDLPVVVCTGFSDNESLAPIRADGHDILFKPCPRGDVLKAVARAVRRRIHK
jgi:CheY-like chemotaxis protein